MIQSSGSSIGISSNTFSGLYMSMYPHSPNFVKTKIAGGYLLLAVASYRSVHQDLDDRFGNLWRAQVQPDGCSLRLEDQRESEKGAAPSLKGDELHEHVRPAVISGKAEGIPIDRFVHLPYILEEINNLFIS